MFPSSLFISAMFPCSLMDFGHVLLFPGTPNRLSYLYPGFLPGIFSRGWGKSIVVQISFVMLLFSAQISRGAKVSRGQTASGGAPCGRKPVSELPWPSGLLQYPFLFHPLFYPLWKFKCTSSARVQNPCPFCETKSMPFHMKILILPSKDADN